MVNRTHVDEEVAPKRQAKPSQSRPTQPNPIQPNPTQSIALTLTKKSCLRGKPARLRVSRSIFAKSGSPSFLAVMNPTAKAGSFGALPSSIMAFNTLTPNTKHCIFGSGRRRRRRWGGGRGLRVGCVGGGGTACSGFCGVWSREVVGWENSGGGGGLG